jgi:hypothetical protein
VCSKEYTFLILFKQRKSVIGFVTESRLRSTACPLALNFDIIFVEQVCSFIVIILYIWLRESTQCVTEAPTPALGV